LIVRPAVIECMFKLLITNSQNQHLECYIAKVMWFQNHPKRYFYGLRSPIELWSTSHERESNNYIPIQFIHGEFVYFKENKVFGQREADDVNVVIPLPDQSM